MASFQAKNGLERDKISLRFVPTQRVIENSNKIAKKFKKTTIYHYAFISSQNRLVTAEKERI